MRPLKLGGSHKGGIQKGGLGGCSWTPKTGTRVGTSLAFYRGQKGPSLENSEKSLKRGSRGLSAPGPKKLEKESKMTISRLVFDLFLTFFALF